VGQLSYSSSALPVDSSLVLRPGFTPAHPYLAFFRAGPSSLHRKILAEDPQRNWDIGVSWWSTPLDAETLDIQCFGGDNKYEGFLGLLHDAAFVSQYRYVLLLDDDVDFRPGDVSRLFELCDRHALYLAQPALNRHTNVNHVVTVRNPFCEVRRVSFVEVMAPCFSARAIQDLQHTFGLTRSTCGIDLAWASLLRDRDLIRVVDAVSVNHTKPVDLTGGAFYRKLRSLGVDAYAEAADVMRRFPDFGGPRTLRGGHVYRPGLPTFLAAPAAAAGDAAIRLRCGLRDALRRLRDRALRRP